jgi:hypothetical protein
LDDVVARLTLVDADDLEVACLAVRKDSSAWKQTRLGMFISVLLVWRGWFM